MMKKNGSLIFLFALLVLVGISVYIYFSKSSSSTVEGGDRNFAFKDTAAITKIFIADKEGDRSTLERTTKGWVVNGKYQCRGEAILNLLEVIKHVEVKMPVPKQARENVIKFMSANAMKVEIYAGDELVKQYYVGHETEDSEASYMLLTDPHTGENYADPYACFIPGFVGFLQPRFIAKENEWRDRVVINYTPPQLRQIKLQYFDVPKDSSFVIELLSTTSYKLKNGNGAEVPFDVLKIKQYLAYFQNISYEALITGKNKKLFDSLATQKPFCVLSVTTSNFKTDEYKFYRKQFLGDVNPELGVKYEYDPDRLYLRFANNNEWALIQYFVFGKLLATRHYFDPVTVKK